MTETQKMMMGVQKTVQTKLALVVVKTPMEKLCVRYKKTFVFMWLACTKTLIIQLYSPSKLWGTHFKWGFNQALLLYKKH